MAPSPRRRRQGGLTRRPGLVTGMPTHDIVVAGAGHNSLTTAAYAAQAGFDVGVVEATETIGGNTKTKELTEPGLRQDLCATAHNLIQASPTLKEDELGLLADYGLKYIQPDPVITVPFGDGTSVTMWRERERTAEEIATFSDADAEAYLETLDEYEQVAPYYARARYTPPKEGSVRAALAEAPNGDEWVRRSMESLLDVITRRFEHPKAVSFMLYLATLVPVPVDRPGTGMGAFALPYGRQSSSWILPEGGSIQLPRALEACLTDHGGAVYTDRPVDEILVDGGRASGVRTSDGTTFEAEEAVVSTIHVTKLPEVLPDEHVPEDFRRGVDHWKPGITLFAVHYAVEEPPRYEVGGEPLESVAMGTGADPAHAIEAAAAFRKGELYLDEPFVLAQTPTLVDPTRSDDGLHSLKLISELPYDYRGEASWDEIKGEVADALLERVREFAPNLTDDVVVARDIQSPVDLERRNPHNVRGSCHGGDSTPDQSGKYRPVEGYANYRGPVDGLYLTGACTFPGGSVSAAPGRNCATVLLEDLGPGLGAGIRDS